MKLKSFNNKAIAVVLTSTIALTTLTGCKSINNIKYEKNEQGQIQGISEALDYDYVIALNFYRVENIITNEKYYTIGSDFDIDNGWKNKKYDIFTKEDIDNEDVFKYECVDSIEKYLIAWDLVKNTYTEAELRDLLNKFIEYYEKGNQEKQLVKEK